MTTFDWLSLLFVIAVVALSFSKCSSIVRSVEGNSALIKQAEIRDEARYDAESVNRENKARFESWVHSHGECRCGGKLRINNFQWEMTIRNNEPVMLWGATCEKCGRVEFFSSEIILRNRLDDDSD